MISMAGLASANPRNVSKDQTENTRGRIIDQAKRDEGFRALKRHLQHNGLVIDMPSTTAERVVTDRGGYDYAIFELVHRGNGRRRSTGQFQADGQNQDIDEEAVIIYVANDTIGLNVPNNVIAYELKRNSSGRNTSSTFFGYDQVTTYTVNNNEVIEHYPDISSQEPSNNPVVSAHSHNDFCEIDVCLPPESRWSFACVVRLVIDTISAVGSCVSCILDPSRLSCSLCLIAGGATADQFVICTGGWSVCDTKTVEVEKEWLNSHDDSAFYESKNENPCEYYSADNNRVLPLPQEYFENQVPTR